MNFEMKRSDRKLAESEAYSILQSADYGVLSTIGENGYPYGVPVNYLCDENNIYFHCALDVGHKLVNISSCSNVCFTVVGKSKVIPDKFATEYESVIVFGQATEVLCDKKLILEKLIAKYSAQFIESGAEYISKAAEKTGVYKINIQQITGKALRNIST